MVQDPTQPLRSALVAQLRKAGNIQTAGVARAFVRVRRHAFVPEHPLHLVYADRVLITKTRAGVATSSSSQPTIMAIMLEQLRVRRGMSILEIGTGTGYNAALLAELVGPNGSVVSIDIQADVAAQARRTLKREGYANVRVVRGDGARGLRSAAPFDRIIATAGCWQIARDWVRQLKDGGVLVLPLRLNLAHAAVAFRKQGEDLVSFSASPCGFMPLQGGTGRRRGRRLGSAQSPMYLSSDYRGPRLHAAGLAALLRTPPRRVLIDGLRPIVRLPQSSDFSRFLSLQGMPLVGISGVSDTVYDWGIVDTVQGSLCLLSPQDVQRGEAIVYGTDYAADALQGQLARWRSAGKPGVGQLRLRVAPTASFSALGELPHPAADGTYQFRRRGLKFTAWYETGS